MRKSSITRFFLLFIFIVSCTSRSSNIPSLKKGNTVSGKVIAVIDGDTYDVLLYGNKIVRVRMEGIDAPEKGMPFYQKSKKYLSDLCLGKQITIKITGVDNHDRLLAYSFLEDGKELSHEMIKAGFAWHFKKYNSNSELSELEFEAKTLKKGLWIDKNPMAPWENRKLHRDRISTKDTFTIVGNNR